MLKFELIQRKNGEWDYVIWRSGRILAAGTNYNTKLIAEKQLIALIKGIRDIAPRIDNIYDLRRNLTVTPYERTPRKRREPKVKK